jgi:activator of 2-hydroxyglutaryl-CoA dehydratase
MAVVGIDLGTQSTKVVILEGAAILGGASLSTGESAETAARMAVQEALRQTGLKREDLKGAVATGTLAVPVTAALNIEDSVKNERCAVSSGALLDIVGRMLQIPVVELGPMSLQATAPQTVSSRCVVFAEGEILSFIHKDPPVPIPDVLAGANQCIADGLWGMVQKVGVPSELLICGGVAGNAGLVKGIEAQRGKPLSVPVQPQYLRALGAAVFARQMERTGGASC